MSLVDRTLTLGARKVDLPGIVRRERSRVLHELLSGNSQRLEPGDWPACARNTVTERPLFGLLS